MSRRKLRVAAMAAVLACQTPAVAEAGHVTGIGGIFVKSHHPNALAAWYWEVLGMDIALWGGAALAFDAPGHAPKVSWMAFPETSDHMAPSAREFMITWRWTTWMP